MMFHVFVFGWFSNHYTKSNGGWHGLKFEVVEIYWIFFDVPQVSTTSHMICRFLCPSTVLLEKRFEQELGRNLNRCVNLIIRWGEEIISWWPFLTLQATGCIHLVVEDFLNINSMAQVWAKARKRSSWMGPNCRYCFPILPVFFWRKLHLASLLNT